MGFIAIHKSSSSQAPPFRFLAAESETETAASGNRWRLQLRGDEPWLAAKHQSEEACAEQAKRTGAWHCAGHITSAHRPSVALTFWSLKS
jgi:hypothetical protein